MLSLLLSNVAVIVALHLSQALLLEEAVAVALALDIFLLALLLLWFTLRSASARLERGTAGADIESSGSHLAESARTPPRTGIVSQVLRPAVKAVRLSVEQAAAREGFDANRNLAPAPNPPLGNLELERSADDRNPAVEKGRSFLRNPATIRVMQNRLKVLWDTVGHIAGFHAPPSQPRGLNPASAPVVMQGRDRQQQQQASVLPAAADSVLPVSTHGGLNGPRTARSQVLHQPAGAATAQHRSNLSGASTSQGADNSAIPEADKSFSDRRLQQNGLADDLAPAPAVEDNNHGAKAYSKPRASSPSEQAYFW